MSAARAWHAFVAACVLVGLVLQVWLTFQVSATPPGHLVGALQGTDLAGRLLRVISFFTIQSNILCGITSVQLARDPQRDGRGWRIVRLAALFGIATTGVVYATVLAAVHEPHGWRETTSNLLFHYVVPIATVLGWLLFGPRPRITGSTVGFALLWPIAWFGYTLLRGEYTDWYPYGFVDAATHGYARVAVNALAVTAVFAALCGLLYLGDRKLPPMQSVTSRRGQRTHNA